MLRLRNLSNSNLTADQITSYLRITLIEAGGVISHTDLFQQVKRNNFYIYMTSRQQNPRNPLQRSFVYIWTHKSGGKTLAVFNKYPDKIVKVKVAKSNREVTKHFKQGTQEKLDAWIF